MSFVVKPNQKETIIHKHAASIFIGTHFERMIRNTNIDIVIFTGIATEFGIESSARDYANRDFYTVIVSDAGIFVRSRISYNIFGKGLVDSHGWFSFLLGFLQKTHE